MAEDRAGAVATGGSAAGDTAAPTSRPGGRGGAARGGGRLLDRLTALAAVLFVTALAVQDLLPAR